MTRLVHNKIDQEFGYRDWLWRRVREDVLARDRYRCQAKIGEHSGTVSVHHLLPLRHDGDLHNGHNLVTLCRAHHEQLEKRTRGSELEILVPNFSGQAHRIRRIAQHQQIGMLEWVRRILEEAIERDWVAVDKAERARRERPMTADEIRFESQVSDLFMLFMGEAENPEANSEGDE